MASANFNTEIVSSDSNGQIRSYSLDNVISKDFEGPYDYNFNTEVPDGISIEITDKYGYTLVIFPNIEFELSIIVGNENKTTAIATTMITIEGKPDFNKIKEEFYEKSNFGQKKEESAQNWVNILSERIPNNEESVVSTR